MHQGLEHYASEFGGVEVKPLSDEKLQEFESKQEVAFDEFQIEVINEFKDFMDQQVLPRGASVKDLGGGEITIVKQVEAPTDRLLENVYGAGYVNYTSIGPYTDREGNKVIFVAQDEMGSNLGEHFVNYLRKSDSITVEDKTSGWIIRPKM